MTFCQYASLLGSVEETADGTDVGSFLAAELLVETSSTPDQLKQQKSAHK